MPNETFAKIKHWETLDLVMLRNLLHREIHRRIECVIIGLPHTEKEIKAYDEKAKIAEAVQGGDIRSYKVEVESTPWVWENAQDAPQEPKAGQSD